MSPLLFWGTVIVATIILGVILPKIFHVLIRLLVFVLAFVLILWGLSKVGITPDTFTKKVTSFWKKEEPQKKRLPNKKVCCYFFTE